MTQNCWIFGAEAYPNPSLKGRAFLSLPQPLPKGKGFSNFDMRGCAGFVQCSVLGLCNVL